MRAQRNAADGFNTFAAEDTQDFEREAVELRAAENGGLARGKAAAGGRGVERNSGFGPDEILTAREVERMNLQQAGGRVEESEARVVMVDDALERGHDAEKQFREFAAGDEDVVDLEKHPEAVALASELVLVGLGSLEIERVVHGHGHL